MRSDGTSRSHAWASYVPPGAGPRVFHRERAEDFVVHERLEAAMRGVRNDLAQNPEAQVRVIETIAGPPKDNAVAPDRLGGRNCFPTVVGPQACRVGGNAPH